VRARTRFVCFYEAVSIRVWAWLGLLAAIAAQVGCSEDSGNDGAGGSTSASGSAGTPGFAGGGASSGGSSGSAAGSMSVAGASSGGGGSGGVAQGGGGSGGSSGGGAAGGTASGKGSAAKWVCEAGASYGDPLAGMGAVSSVAAPQGDYFAFIEGPIWIASTKTIYFSDNASSPSERIFKLVPPSTTAASFVAASGSNGLGVDNDGNIIAADQRNKQISRFDPSSAQMVGTPISTGSAKPNDVIVRSDGNIYFSDPDSGFYRIAPGGAPGEPMKFAQSTRPNGVVLSLDENTLYVGDVGGKAIAKYTLAADGSVMGSGSAFVAQTKNDTVDGMCVDCAGNVYAGTANGVEVYSPAGAYLGTVPTGEASNCTFGGADRKTLYVTSRSVLKYVALAVPGLPD
jgi:gluconolactonase